MIIDLENIRRQFQRDRFAIGNGIVIDSVTEDRVVCGMELNDDHRNMADGVQGGAIFTLADLAFAVYSNLAMVCGEDAGVTVGQSCGISFLKGIRGATSTCVSKERSVSRLSYQGV